MLAITAFSAGARFSNFGSLKSTETQSAVRAAIAFARFSNFGSLKSTETRNPLHVTERRFVSAISAR